MPGVDVDKVEGKDGEDAIEPEQNEVLLAAIATIGDKEEL